MTVLIACSHGTRSPEGRATVRALTDAVAERLPEVRVVSAFVDVEDPSVDEVVASLPAAESAVVVPLLLSTGYHTRVDIARAVASRPGTLQAPPLGPHDLLAQTLVARVSELPDHRGGLDEGDHVVLAAAGSSDPAAAADVGGMRELLRQRLDVPVTVGYAAGARPRISEAVATARAAGARRVIAASYVLAPGHFADLVGASGADAVSAPLGPDPRVAALVVQRFRQTLEG